MYQSDIAPGMKLGMPEQEYHSDISFSGSLALYLKQTSLAHLKVKLDRIRASEAAEASTDAQETGTVCHKAILEWDSFETNYIAKPKGFNAGHVKANAEKHPDFLKAAMGKRLCDQADYYMAKGMATAAWNHEDAGPLLRSQNRKEVSLFSRVGAVCLKGRLDLAAQDWSIVSDIKTTSRCLRDPGEFITEIYRCGYHIKMAAYYDLCQQLFDKSPRLQIVAIEKRAPYACRVYEVCGHLLLEGLGQWYALVDTYRAAIETNCWPGYEAGIIKADDIPQWAASAEEVEEEPW